MKDLRLGILVPLAFCLFLTPAFAGDFIKDTSGNWLVSSPGDKDAAEPTAADYQESILTVVSEDYDVVGYTLKVGGKTTKQKYNTERVSRIFYEPHQGYAQAAQAMSGGRWDEALQRFEALAKARSNRFWVRMYSLLNMADIYGAQGRWQKQIDAFDRLLKDFPRTRYIDKAYVEKGRAYLRLNNPGQAELTFKRLQRVSGLPAGKKALARYWLIYIKQVSGQVDAALAEYRQLLDDVQGDPELKDVAILARLGIGTCMVLKKQYDDALAFFQEIADSSDDSAVLSGAFNGLGKCYFEQNRWDKALLAFLRTALLYEDNPEHTALAIYYAGKCFQFLAPDHEGYATRARELYRECIQRFPSSHWSQQSRRDLPGVRGK